MLEKWMEYSEEVLKAKKVNKLGVALESTIISHGMPYPSKCPDGKRS
ncbi:hypothetical protein GCM10009865_20860 [Aeromicrobium ponti]|uniref:Pseudouridine-5'-phosphate glycosidase n=1 Tax=Cytobacillus oceanisediminis TaxID=665099 RepID=A0A562JX65_9BACI|nr:pseudouridine-5'-phosphate glycosidase [Cytobacillus oceanisediminis]